MKKKVFNIIQIGDKSNTLSRLFDIFIAVVICANILVTFLQTFDELSFLFPAFHVIEVITILIFCVEYILRIWTADYLYPERFFGLIVSDVAGTTRDAIDSKLETEFGKFTLIDTAGLRRKSKVKEEIERYSVIRTYAAIERADVCILMIDATEGVTEQDEKIIGYAHELGKAIMVIVNKWDLIEKDDKTMDIYKKDLANSLKFLSYLNTYLSLQKLAKEHIKF